MTGSSVIVKVLQSDVALGFTDWACLRFLAGVPVAAGLVPAFLGGDRVRRVFVMEDLGGSRSLDDVLRGPDPAAVTRALETLARAYARLHVGTLGEAARFQEVCREVPEAAAHDRRQEAQRWLDAWPKFLAWLEAAGVDRLAPGLDAAVEQIAQVYRDPGPFLAFSHGDPAPSNNHVGEGRVRLLDFEYGGFRHALYDATAWDVLCPLPEELVAVFRKVYRRELALGCPAARDRDRFDEAWAHLAAYRAVALLTWLPTDVLRQNRAWVGGWTIREAALAAVSRLRANAAGAARLAPLAQAAERLFDSLLTRWPEHRTFLPRWPALVGATRR